MNRKLMPLIFAAMLSLSMFAVDSVYMASANFFPPSIPSPAITIQSDGSISPLSAPIQQIDNIYTFKENIVGYTLVIHRNNIIIDGAGYTLQGNGNSTGIFLQDMQHVVVKNLTIKGFFYGVWLTWGLSVDQGAKYNTITNNIITNNTYGIYCPLFTSSNTITENTITDNEYGIYIAYSPSNVLRNNHLHKNTYNLWVDCLLSNPGSGFINDIDTSNTVDGKPIYYWVNEKDKTVPSDAGYVALVRCVNITVQGLNLSHNGQGVLLVETNNSKVTGNYITKNNYGIALFGMYAPCTNNTITQNTINENTKNIYTYLDDSTNIIKDNPDTSITPTASHSPTSTTTSTPTRSPLPSPTTSTTPNPTTTPSLSPSHSIVPAPSIPELTMLLVPVLLAIASVLLVIFRRKVRGQ
jgi:parallel beta-helix repeat protein